MKIGGYLFLVFALVGGFHFSTMMPGLGGRVCFIGHVFKVLNMGLGTNLWDFFCLGILYFHALILFIAHVIERLIDRFYITLLNTNDFIYVGYKVAAKNIGLKGKVEDKQF